MPRDVIPFRAGPSRRPGVQADGPNVAFAALGLLRKLNDTLAAAVPFRDACRARERKATRWGVPPLFFFAGSKGQERPAARPNFLADRFTVPTARQMPIGARAWADLTDLIDDAFTACAASVEVRRVARAVPQLRDRLASFAANHNACHEFAALLAATDDVIVTVLYPAARAGFRFQLQGIVNLDQLHVLLADAATGSPTRGYFPGTAPDARVADAYIDQPTDPAAEIATASYQLFRPNALRSDGTLPTGFDGAANWLWGHESPHVIPTVLGERVLLLGEATYPRQWPVGRRFSALKGELHLLRMLPREEVDGWVERITKQPQNREMKRAA
ncbi:hypothetical protein [Limnoglobus roseus]|uniref:Uncharacterized protein n=1 Tax=Limnoglobus roseus TaxID=2598579 RepID=A0A5C1A8Z8_9BACT|nr:hypothetical protein [Limnoglobus roseus]QEL15180.1 hypothetical protein PX52LOC_02095 [Limnoglobus roseus]